MAKLLFCILSENIITDSTDNKVSIINLVEVITTTALPAVYPLLNFFCLWEKDIALDDNEHIDARLDIEYIGTEEPPREKPISLEIPSGNKNLRSFLRLEGLPLKHEGEVRFSIKQELEGEWKEIGFYNINVKKVTG